MHDLRRLQNPYRRHWSDEFQKQDFFLGNRAPGVLGHLAAIKALYLTLQTLLGLVKTPWKPYACFQRATELREVSLVR